jgi:uncharacterized protein (DUF983 family)
MIAENAAPAMFHATDRGKWRSMMRGFSMHCPNCGKGALYYRYLKVNDSCAECGEELFHQRADDAPPYITILIVAHIVGAAMLAVDEWNNNFPIWIQSIVWPLLVIALSLVLLPRVKGALIGLQWALRMHGFETALPANAATKRP